MSCLPGLMSLSINLFCRYEELYIRHALEAIPGFQWCIAKGCKSGQVHRGKDPKLRCVECRTAQCVRHKVPWHAGESCNEYSYRQVKSPASDDPQLIYPQDG